MEKERQQPDDNVKGQLDSLQEQITRLEKIGKMDDDSSMDKINQLVQEVKKTAEIKEEPSEEKLEDDMGKISEIQRLAGGLKKMLS